MQRLIPVFLILFCVSAFRAGAQHYHMLLSREGEVPVIDMINLNGENVYDVARFRESYLNYPCAVLTGVKAGEILATYIKTDSVRSIEMARSPDGGRTWNAEAFRNRWDGETFRSLSMFHLGQPYIAPGTHRTRKARRSTLGKNNLMLFSGGSPILVSSSYTNGEQWCNFYPANNFGGFRISGLVRLRDGRHMALLHDDGRFLYPDDGHPVELRKSAIYKIYSSDGGLTWSAPEIALKHNVHGLYDAVVVYSPSKNDSDLILIASERETSAAYISFSSDNSASWSYPEKLPSFIQGDRFGIATIGRNLIIAFRDMGRTLRDGSPNPTFGDLVLWTGDLRELVRGNRLGFKVRVADNYPTGGPADYNDRKYYDCGYISVLPIARNEVAIIAYGRWETEELPFIRNYTVHPVNIRQYLNEQP